MNDILKAVAMAKPVAAGSNLRQAESHYHQALKVFGVDSGEAKVAWHYWHALRRQTRASR
jgi:hypothetical protein